METWTRNETNVEIVCIDYEARRRDGEESRRKENEDRSLIRSLLRKKKSWRQEHKK